MENFFLGTGSFPFKFPLILSHFYPDGHVATTKSNGKKQSTSQYH